MGLIIVIVILFLIFGGGGGWYGYRRQGPGPELGPAYGWNPGWGIGGIGTVLVILLILYALGILRIR